MRVRGWGCSNGIIGSTRCSGLLTDYIHAAMCRARYEILEDDHSFYGEIPGFQGVCANAPTLEACREELEAVLEDWILVCVSRHVPTPVLDGIDLNIKQPA